MSAITINNNRGHGPLLLVLQLMQESIVCAILFCKTFLLCQSAQEQITVGKENHPALLSTLSSRRSLSTRFRNPNK